MIVSLLSLLPIMWHWAGAVYWREKMVPSNWFPPHTLDATRTKTKMLLSIFLYRCNLREFNLKYYAYRQKRMAGGCTTSRKTVIFYSHSTEVTLPLHNFALVVKYSFRWDNCIEKKLSPVGSQEVLSERKVGYISCKQAFCSKVWNIYRNAPAKLFSGLHLFLYFLHILNCRSVSKLSLNWGHELLQAAGEFFQTKRNPFWKCRNLAEGDKGQLRFVRIR